MQKYTILIQSSEHKFVSSCPEDMLTEVMIGLRSIFLGNEVDIVNHASNTSALLPPLNVLPLLQTPDH